MPPSTMICILTVAGFSPPTGHDAGAYDITTGKEPPVPVDSAFTKKYTVAPDQLPDFKMIDLCATAPRKNVSANFATYTGFKSACDISEWSRIDFIFGGNMGWWVLSVRSADCMDPLTVTAHVGWRTGTKSGLRFQTMVSLQATIAQCSPMFHSECPVSMVYFFMFPFFKIFERSATIGS